MGYSFVQAITFSEFSCSLEKVILKQNSINDFKLSKIVDVVFI